VAGLKETAAGLTEMLRDRLAAHKLYITRYGEDMPEIRDWVWPYR
jgi:xylulose-5-phosphate/fructose-6-phosphate phosphoketolase